MPFTWLYVHEVGRRQGLHTHILLAMPLEHRDDFRAWLPQRLADIAKVKALPREAYSITAAPSDRLWRQWYKFRYFFKGIDPQAKMIAKLGPDPYIPVSGLIGVRPKWAGPIRCETLTNHPHSLRPAARAADGFKSLVEMNHLDVRYLYAGMNLYDYHLRGGGDLTDAEVDLLAVRVEKARAIYDDAKREDPIHLPTRRRRKRLALDAVKAEEEHKQQLARLSSSLFTPPTTRLPGAKSDFYDFVVTARSASGSPAARAPDAQL